jgi:ADP-ribosylglycohydrolase
MDHFTLSERYRGCLLGLACGDAVGTTVEFAARGSFAPITDMVGGGPFGLPPGKWTDDTSMALCLAESLLAKNGFDPRDQMARYLNWWQWGYNSSTGECFDIGLTVRSSLMAYMKTGEPFAGSTDPKTAGNGSLMRLAPVAMFYFPDFERVSHFSAESSRTTHGAQEALECCKLFGVLLAKAFRGDPKDSILDHESDDLEQPNVRRLLGGAVRNRTRDQIAGTGYCVQSLEAALWCFAQTESFEAAVLEAANLGDDADTTAAITGQLAGAYYGMTDIPARWLDRLHLREEIDTTAQALLRASAVR